MKIKYFGRIVKDEFGITILAIAFIVILQGIAIYFLYLGKKYEISEKLRETTIWAIGFHNEKESMIPDGKLRMASVNPEKNEVSIRIENKTYCCKIDSIYSSTNVYAIISYDLNLRNPMTLACLDSLVVKKMREIMGGLPLVFVKVDSLGNKKELCPSDMVYDHMEIACEVPLGFISGDRVVVWFNFPWIYFCKKHLLLISVVASLGTLIVCFVIMFLFRIRKHKQLQIIQDECIRQEMHDFNTPMIGIKSTLEWISESLADHLNEEGNRRLKLAKDAAHQVLHNRGYMLETLSEILGIQIQREVFDFESELEKVIGVQVIASENVKSVDIKLDYRLPSSEICASKFYLMRAISNLLDNAVKYSGDRVEVTVHCYPVGKGIMISVEDRGKGIPLSEHRKIFAKFYRYDKNKRVEGFGLGLHFVKTVVEKHGGKITVESEPNEGSTFYIYLKKWKEK